MEWSSKGFVGFHRAPNYPPCLPDHNGDDHGKKEQNVMMRKNNEGRWKKSVFWEVLLKPRKAMQLRTRLFFVAVASKGVWGGVEGG